ncbi:imidazole glycerol phosphate synthase subunit HisH [Chakrabartyella piscis]|uniref:imidazole glycerol phosphate synthase subunit HisH n=1 Tax=Chakrabartyella piscis TaxID=2918914 RepID=UPI0029587911|nr:imidazole glycerol phosphate synthase subunit HisH [Chakrabartyella piscis]
MIAIVDYGVGNLFSLQSSLQFIGIDVVVTKDAKVLEECDKIILPGVGAFSDAMKKFRESGLDEVILSECKKGKPLLGICLGMQMLFERSMEYGEHKGLGLIQGSVDPIAPMITEGLKVPHIGWNALVFPKDKEISKLYTYVKEGDCVYYVHSFAATGCEVDLTAQAEYGGLLTGSVERKNVYGTQFHPEKSGEVGLNILKAFCELA